MKKLLIPFFVFSTLLADAQSLNVDSVIAPKIKKVKSGPLFKSDDTLNFTLFADLKPLLRDRGDNPKNHWGMVKYLNHNNKLVEIPIKVCVRGNFRRMTQNCTFPPLLLDFDKKKKGNSIFNHQNKLKLVTHCLKKDYIMEEYLVYKIFNIITDYSFKARIANVTYEDSLGKQASQTRLAFLLEDDEDLAKRIHSKYLKDIKLRQNQVDTLKMATVSVFEYLIGNTDWSVPFQHNIKIYFKKGEKAIPIPYDFDHSGIVNAIYAKPAEQLIEISSVRERLYRGFAYSPLVFQIVFDKFKAVKPEIYSLYVGNTELEPNYIKSTLKYLDEFYEIIDNKKLVKREFIDQGLKNMGPGSVQIQGLNSN